MQLMFTGGSQLTSWWRDYEKLQIFKLQFLLLVSYFSMQCLKKCKNVKSK